MADYSDIISIFNWYVLSKEVERFENEWEELKEEREAVINNEKIGGKYKEILIDIYTNEMEKVLKQLVIFEEYYNI